MSARRLLLAALAALAVLPPAGASALQVGISDQHAPMFSDPLFAPLKLRYARLVVPWNIARMGPRARRPVEDWLAGAARTGVQPHIAFGNPSYAPQLRGKGPSPSRFMLAVKAFHRRWPQVRVFTPWNEETHSYAPTFKRPRLAARYYRVVKSVCPRCQVVAADMLDLPNLTNWLRGFLRWVPGRPRLWGLHNYRDANRGYPLRSSWTLKLTRMVKGRIWVTESGGITGQQRGTGGDLWPYSPKRAGRSLRHLFKLIRAPAVRARYRRVYVYSFYGAWSRRKRLNGWDSGLLGITGKPRPAYGILKRAARKNMRAARR